MYVYIYNWKVIKGKIILNCLILLDIFQQIDVIYCNFLFKNSVSHKGKES